MLFQVNLNTSTNAKLLQLLTQYLIGFIIEKNSRMKTNGTYLKINQISLLKLFIIAKKSIYASSQGVLALTEAAFSVFLSILLVFLDCQLFFSRKVNIEEQRKQQKVEAAQSKPSDQKRTNFPSDRNTYTKNSLAITYGSGYSRMDQYFKFSKEF